MILAAIVTTTLLSGMHLERDLGPAGRHTYTLETCGGAAHSPMV